MRRLTCVRVPKVYAGIYPVDSNDFLKLEESIKRVTEFAEFPGVSR